MNRSLLFSSFVIFLCAPALSAVAATAFERDCAVIAGSTNQDSVRLNALLKLSWDYTMHEYPEFATDVGYPGQNDRWTDLSIEALERRKVELQAPLKAIQSIHREKLNSAEKLNYDLFKRNQERAIEGAAFPSEYLQLSQLDGIQQDAARMLEIAPHTSVKDYEDLIARLLQLPKVIEQTVALLKKGLDAGVTPPRITLRDVPQQVKNQMEPASEKNALLKPFADFPAEIPEADRLRLQKAAAAALHESGIPAFGKLHDFIAASYVPGARESIAMLDLPNGKAWYAYNVRERTTTSLSPSEIHQLGLSEVKRIRGEMDKVIKQTGFKGSFEDFLTFLRKDPKFYYTNAEELLRGYRDIAKRVDPELAKLFGKLPRLPYGVIPIPSYAEKSQTTAYYQPGAPEAGRPGNFFANTYALETRPKWEMEALTLHEAVPGHHLQIALAQEMEEAPEFRKHGGYTAFVEGWGLYSESLGTEMGFYKDPYMKFGQLTYEMWRAIRLVVDTGIHSMGWTRRQAIDYFLANASKNEHDVTVEVDRYIVWPGQALAYKIGQLKIQELRNYAREKLGDKFDIRKFHDQILGSGALPLDILEIRLKAWVANQIVK
ncbi:MAG: DUF885 domain-containing protein [Verrucomicrobiota bacterium]